MKKSETKRFIAVIDPKASTDSNFHYKALNSPSMIGAMTEASHLIDDDTYLINIFQRIDGITDKEKVFYKKVLTNRGNGWHTNDDPHASERAATIAFYFKYHDGIKPLTSCDFDWLF